MCAIQGELGMSFSSWDDGSWQKILKTEGEEEEEEEFVDHFGQQEGEVGRLTEENIRARKERADAKAAHKEKITEDREAAIEDPVGEEKRTATFGPKGIMGRKDEDDDTDDSTEDTGKKKPKKTDAEYLADYDQREREKQQEYAEQGKTYTGNTAAYDKAQANRDSGNWFTRNIQRGKDFKEKVAENVVRPLTGRNPNVRYGDQANFGRVAGDKGRGPLPRPSQILNVPGKVKQVAYDAGGEVLGSAADAVTGKVGQVKQGVSQKIQDMNTKPQTAKNKEAGAQTFLTGEGREMMQQAYSDLSQGQKAGEAFPDPLNTLSTKVRSLIADASAKVVNNEPVNNVNEIQEWIDMFDYVAPKDAETEKQKETWERVLEASR